MSQDASYSSLSRIKPKLRTQGAVSGNFGRAKVKAGSSLRDLGVSDRETIVLPPRSAYIERMTHLLSSPDPAMASLAYRELHRLGRFKERRLEPAREAPYRPEGT